MEPTVVRDPANPKHLVAAHAVYEPDEAGLARIWIWTQTSGDGGATWTATRLAAAPLSDPTHDLATYNVAGDPVLAFSGGSVILAGIVAHGVGVATQPGSMALANLALFVARSDDGGATFTHAQTLMRGVGSYNDNLDKPGLAVGPAGMLLLTWTRFHVIPTTALAELVQADIHYSVSSDQGRTWTRPGVVAPGHHQGSAPLIGSDGAWHVAFEHTIRAGDPSGSATDLILATSRNQGASWETRTIGRTASGNYPTVRENPLSKTLFLAYASPTDGGTVPALLSSVDGGGTWEGPLLLEASPTRGKTLTALAVDERGVLFATWYRALGEDGTMVYRAGAISNGTVLGPITIAEGLRPQFAQRDYAGLAGLDDGAFAVWVGEEAPATRIHGAKLVWVPPLQ